MNWIRTIFQIGILFLFYLAGEFIVTILQLKFPGSIIGLLILWFCLYMKWLDIRLVQNGASFLITFLTLFFIPSTVGIVQYPELLTTKGMLLLIAVMLSTFFAFIFTGKLSQLLERFESKEGVQKK